MDEKIDNGPIIIQRKFPLPLIRRNIDLFYDSYIRAELLAEVLPTLDKPEMKILPQGENTKSQTYHVIHPILKSIAIYEKKVRKTFRKNHNKEYWQKRWSAIQIDEAQEDETSYPPQICTKSSPFF